MAKEYGLNGRIWHWQVQKQPDIRSCREVTFAGDEVQINYYPVSNSRAEELVASPAKLESYQTFTANESIIVGENFVIELDCPRADLVTQEVLDTASCNTAVTSRPDIQSKLLSGELCEGYEIFLPFVLGLTMLARHITSSRNNPVN